MKNKMFSNVLKSYAIGSSSLVHAKSLVLNLCKNENDEYWLELLPVIHQEWGDDTMEIVIGCTLLTFELWYVEKPVFDIDDILSRTTIVDGKVHTTPSKWFEKKIQPEIDFVLNSLEIDDIPMIDTHIIKANGCPFGIISYNYDDDTVIIKINDLIWSSDTCSILTIKGLKDLNDNTRSITVDFRTGDYGQDHYTDKIVPVFAPDGGNYFKDDYANDYTDHVYELNHPEEWDDYDLEEDTTESYYKWLKNQYGEMF